MAQAGLQFLYSQEETMASLEEPVQRAEVFRGMQSLMLKRDDIKIDRLARVFKVHSPAS